MEKRERRDRDERDRGSSGEDRFTENVTLNFQSVTFEYTPNINGDPIAPVFVSYDLSTQGFGSNTCPA